MLLREKIQWRGYDGRLVSNSNDVPHAFLPIVLSDPPGDKSATTLAFVDTGHTSLEISRRLITHLDLDVSGEMLTHGNVTTDTVPTYRVAVRLAGVLNVTVDMDCVELRNPLGFNEAEAIIGMSFFHYGALLLQGPESDSFFQFLEQRLKPTSRR